MKCYKRRAISGALVVMLLLAGLSTPAWLTGTGGRALAASAPAPDLTIEAVSLSPEMASIGNTLTFTVTIKNRGELSAGASQLTGFIDEHPLATSPVGSIDPGAVTVKTYTWKAQAGAHVFRALIDSDSSIDESAEDNNDKTLAFSVLAADLAVDAISWTPVSPASGDKVTFVITITNQGDKWAGSSHVEFIIDGSTRGYTSIPGLEAGASVNVTLVWTALSGMHNVRAVADALRQVAESDEENNASEATCATALPDLIISSMTVEPPQPLQGETVTLTVLVKNQGSGNAGPSGVTFYVDDSLLDWFFLGSLNAGATATANCTWIATNGTPTLKATVDAEGKVPESNETNNSRTVSLAPIYPDLVIQDVTWTPSSPLIDSLVVFTVTVKNQGKATAGYAEVKLDIDKNTYIFKGAVTALSINGTSTVVFSWMPRSVSHTIKVTVDEANLIKESNDANNTLTKTMTSKKPTPSADLILVSITCSPVRPAIGETVKITLVVKNQGTGLAGASTTAIYLDSHLVDSVYTQELDAGKTVTLEITVPLQGLPLKDYYTVSAGLDCNDTVFETNDSNNEKETSFSIAAPDLIVRAVSWTPEVPAVGGRVTFDVNVKNRGDLKSGIAFVSYYVDNVFMGKHYLENIEAGTTITKSFTWAATKASFTFTTVIDEEEQVIESNESNNTRAVSLPAPDLVIDALTWSPDNPTEISPVFFTAVIRNRGYGWASGSVLYVYIDSASPLSLNTGQIGPGDTTSISFNYAFVPGERIIRLAADGADAVAESSEANNEKTVKFTVQPQATSTPLPAPVSANKTSVKPTAPGPTVTVKASQNPASQNITPAQKPVTDIAANITAPPPGWQGILQNRWIIMGTASMGLAAIGLLLIFRKKARKPSA